MAYFILLYRTIAISCSNTDIHIVGRISRFTNASMYRCSSTSFNMFSIIVYCLFYQWDQMVGEQRRVAEFTATEVKFVSPFAFLSPPPLPFPLFLPSTLSYLPLPLTLLLFPFSHLFYSTLLTLLLPSLPLPPSSPFQPPFPARHYSASFI